MICSKCGQDVAMLIDGICAACDYVPWTATQTHYPSRKPHRCPLCSGSGRTVLPLDNATGGIQCHGCNGTGTVWEPTA